MKKYIPGESMYKLSTLIISLCLLIPAVIIINSTQNNEFRDNFNNIPYTYCTPYNIESGRSNNTIQDAINKAHQNDTLIIPEGTYYETLKINKSIKIIGATREKVIIISNNGYYGTNITSEGCTLSNLTFRTDFLHNGNIYISARNTRITNCSISVVIWINASNNFITNIKNILSIDIHGNNNSVINCSISGGLQGIILQGDNNFIERNIISDSLAGILIHSEKNRLENNYLVNNEYGFWIYGNLNYLTNNTMKNNKFGILLEWGANNNEIYYNNCSDNEIGIYLTKKSKNNNITHNVCLNESIGIFVDYDSKDNNINSNIGKMHFEKESHSDFIFFIPIWLENFIIIFIILIILSLIIFYFIKKRKKRKSLPPS